jgi:hypothetical protein
MQKPDVVSQHSVVVITVSVYRRFTTHTHARAHARKRIISVHSFKYYIFLVENLRSVAKCKPTRRHMQLTVGFVCVCVCVCERERERE